MHAIRLFISELASIGKKPKILIAMIGVALIPIIYCGMFLWAFWDPYSNTQDLPVAVVNNDKGAMLAGERVNIGHDLVDQLKSNKSFDWHFVDGDKADKGFKDNKYFMIITIPEKFSKNATTINDDKVKKLPLNYQLNSDYNYIASIMSESGAKEVKNKAGNEITETFAKVMYRQLDELSDGLNKASKGAGKLADGSSDAEKGINALRKHVSDLASASEQLSNGTNQIAQGSGQLHQGLTALSNGTQELYSQTQSKTNEIQKLADGANTLSSKLQELNQGMNQLSESHSQLTNGSEQIKANMEKIGAGLEKEQQAVQAFQNGVAQAQPIINKLGDNMQQLTQIVNGVGQAKDNSDQLAAAIQNYAKNHPDIAKDPDFQKIMQAGQNENGVINQVRDKTKQALADIQQPGVSDKVKQLVSNASQLASAQNELVNGFKKLEDAQNQVVSGMEQFQKKVNQLPDSTGQLSQGAKTLADGTNSLKQNWSTLTSSIKKLNSSENQLIDGSKKLNDSIGQLSNGMSALTNGTNQIGSGTSELANGVSDLHKGNEDLHTQLGDAHKQTESIPKNNEHADMFAKPIDLHNKTHSNVNNYGYGLAPYFLSLGLFVGAVMLTIIYDLREPALKPRTGISWALGKYFVMAVMGIVQALIADVIVLFGLGLKVDQPMIFILFSILASLTFMALIQFFAGAFGNPGRFCIIIILILQLTTTGGTYPVQLIPKPLQSIPQWLPMNYSIAGFRNIIAGHQTDMLKHNALILAVFLIVMLAASIVFFTLHNRKLRKNEAEGQENMAV
ncbi:putative membrane protein [Scopulibacillus daqui]|uniref:Membrane protein n=1 Tax=Scopulibacillus daqui TaxID=1469162 RepID=A0ABS2PVC5_9BACL|nr:putative membrane protein [Scopulibacillus daqui]